MRLSTILLLTTLLNVSASIYSQSVKLSFNLDNVTVKEVLAEIERNSNYRFLYRNELIDVNQKVNIDASDETVDAVLTKLFDSNTTEYRIFDGDIIVITNKNIQQTQISGTVKDANTGDPLPGVNIIVEGTTIGVTTDIQGKYSLVIPKPNSVLVFSFIGYINETVPTEGKSVIDINLIPDIQKLEEVVVVGYGTQKKSDITGSVTSVPKDRLSKLPVNNIMQAIQGIAAGVNVTQASSIPGDAPTTIVRGKGSITASSDPYIVVDGIPLSKTDASINDINPNDIESVEILKDASATAIYGTNGANGVILITTKRGKTGKPTIRYNAYGGLEEFSHILEPMTGPELVAAYKEYTRIQPDKTLWPNSEIRNEYEYDNWKNGITTDWIDAISQQGIVQDHNLSISGGTDNSKYFISAEYLDQKGILKGYNYKRYSIRTNLDANVTKYLLVGTNSYFAAHNNDGGRSNLVNASAMSPYGKMYNNNGTYTQYPMFGENLWANPLLNTTLNPERRKFNATINGFADVDFGKIWQPLSGLKYKLNAGYTFAPQRTNEYEGKSVYNQTGHGKMYNRESQTWTLENIVTFSKDINVHHFDITGLYAAKRKYFQEATAEANVFPNDDLEWGKLEAATTPSVKSYADLYTSVSQMGRLNYSYNSSYLITVTVRRDGSSVFGADHKYGIFPSVALGWNLAKETFMSSLNNIINDTKIRVSYGKSGNEAIGVYQSLPKMEANLFAMGGKSVTSLKMNRSLGNAGLSWETSTTFNTGLDFGLYNNRINGTVDLYFSTNTDLLMKRSLPTAIGYDNQYANLGKTANQGIEITLNTKNIASKDFMWNTTIVFASNKNEIKELYGDGKDDKVARWFLGQPLGVIYDYTKVGIWQAEELAAGEHTGWDAQAVAGDLKLADISGPLGVPDGKVDENDRSILGQTYPKWTGGITNTFSYKGLSLSFFISTVQGLMLNNAELSMASDERGRRATPREIGYWTPDNKSNEWRSLGNHSNSHGYGFPSDASYTRLKDVTISYTLPETLLRKIGINGLQLYLSGRNLYTFTNWIGWDPEARDLGRGSSIENNTIDWTSNYPLVRSYILGINLTL